MCVANANASRNWPRPSRHAATRRWCVPMPNEEEGDPGVASLVSGALVHLDAVTSVPSKLV
jgi:hypothetical protein